MNANGAKKEKGSLQYGQCKKLAASRRGACPNHYYQTLGCSQLQHQIMPYLLHFHMTRALIFKPRHILIYYGTSRLFIRLGQLEMTGICSCFEHLNRTVCVGEPELTGVSVLRKRIPPLFSVKILFSDSWYLRKRFCMLLLELLEAIVECTGQNLCFGQLAMLHVGMLVYSSRILRPTASISHFQNSTAIKVYEHYSEEVSSSWNPSSLLILPNLETRIVFP